MQPHDSPWCCAVILAMTLLTLRPGSALADPPRGSGDRVTILLNPTSTSTGDDVLIADIARVETTNSTLKAQIESLDLATAPSPGQSTIITPRLVEFRLRVAGIHSRDIVIRGTDVELKGGGGAGEQRADRTVNRRAATDVAAIRYASLAEDKPSPLLSSSRDLSPPNLPRPAPARTDELDRNQTVAETVIAVARRTILQQLPWDEQDISFRLVQPLGRDVELAGPRENCQFAADIRTSGPPVGRVTVDVTIDCKGQAPIVVPVSFDVRHYVNVVQTARPIPRGRQIQKEDLYLNRWDVSGLSDYCTQTELLVGRVAGRTIPALQIIKEQDLERSASTLAPAGRTVVIKRQDRIQMTAVVGDLKISVRGEAMQDGRLGETIRVQNVESKQIVSGKVLSAEEVEISY
jgi:flagella basal body P-ring formation protein FlgA